MYTVYAVSREPLGPVVPPVTLNLITDFQPGGQAAGNLQPDGMIDFIKERYPNGLSRHGKQYLQDAIQFVTFNGIKYSSYLNYLEFAFEFVREARFPERPSRFMSGFACETIAEARRFRDVYTRGTGKILQYEVSTFFKADMNLLRSGSIPGLILNAEKYWKGEAGSDPFWELLIPYPINVIAKIE